jgi:hypothetical protein
MPRGRHYEAIAVPLSKNMRKTGALSSVLPEGRASSSRVWRLATLPFALLRALLNLLSPKAPEAIGVNSRMRLLLKRK